MRRLLLFLLFVSFELSLPERAMSQAAPCGISIGVDTSIPSGLSLISPATGGPLILYNPQFINQIQQNAGLGAPIFRWLMQHECGHHVLGHVAAGQANPYLLMWMTPQIELAADCYSAKQLFAAQDSQALQAAVMLMSTVAFVPTGPNYPTGAQRAQTLQQCYGL
jgi:hypothetical protein